MPSASFLQRIAGEAQRRAQRRAQRQNVDQQRHLGGLRLRASRLLRETHRHAHQADRYARDQQEASTEVERIEETHPEFTDLGIGWSVLYWTLVAVLPIVYLIDLMLFYQTAVAISRYAFTHRTWMVGLACYLIPFLLIGVELYVASQMYAARHRESTADNLRRSQREWLTLAVVLMIVMPALVISTHPALASWNSTDYQSRLLTWQLVGFVALVVVTHFAVLFGGDTAHNAKAYATFSGYRFWLRRKVQGNEAEYERGAQNAVETFRDYWETLNEHNHLNREAPIAAGPFDSVTRELINQRYGYEVIEAPRAANAGNAAPAGNTGAAGAGNNGGAPPAPAAAPGPTQPPAPAVPPPGGAGHPPTPGPVASPDEAVAQAASTTPHEAAATPAGNGYGGGMEEYYRTLIYGQVRDAESEVRR
jgi:hypothetical protein